jgi:hypothetical protein
MLISRFEEIKMLEEETFGEFYSKMSDLRNSMVSLGKPISDIKLIRKILRSLPERFRIKVTTIEESKDLEDSALRKRLKISVSLSAVWTTCHPVRTPICPLFHLSGRRVHLDRTPNRPASSVRTTCLFRPNPKLYREASVPACIRPDISAACLDAFQYSNSLRLFPSSNKGNIDQPSGRCGRCIIIFFSL